MAARHLLLTGPPRVGKTTLVQRVVDAWPGPALGFVTREVREHGQRVGFRLHTLDGRSAWLAHRRFPHRHRVGPYGVDLAALEALAVPLLRRMAQADPSTLAVIDEIGPMELLSPAFRQALLPVFDRGGPLLATVVLRPHPVADALKARPDVQVLEVTPANRATLVGRVLTLLRGQA